MMEEHNTPDQRQDPAHEAALAYQSYIRKELVLQFLLTLISILLATYALSNFNSIRSHDFNRGYIATNANGHIHYNTPRDLPMNDKVESELQDWIVDKLTYCMTFDFISYALISNECNTKYFSLNSRQDSQYNNGQIFYRALNKSEVVSILLDNQTSMTVDIQEIEHIDSGVKEQFDRSGNLRRLYAHNYRIIMRILMQGQKLDAPITYIVNVERMAETIRENGYGIRSVISQE